MEEISHRDFDKAAASWDEKPQRQQLAAAVAEGISANLELRRDLQALDYGCGTGLTGLRLASGLGHLTAADTSAGMLEQLQKKCRDLNLQNVSPVLIPPDRWALPDAAFDLIFSSMVLHHITAIEPLLCHFHQALKPAGFLALADLQQEDGSFHDDPTGVAHHGFDPQALMASLQRLGFTDLSTRTVHTVVKQRDDQEFAYPVFLIIGRKA